MEYTRLINKFKLRNIKVDCFQNLQEVKNAILSLVPVNCTVGIGHSATLQMINISEELIK